MEFDTYRAIEKLAKHPDSSIARAAFLFLLRRTSVKVTWDAWKQAKSEQMGSALMHLRTGAAYAKHGFTESGKNAGEPVKDFSQMSKEELKEFYLTNAKNVGIDIDPSLLDKDKDDPEQPGTQQDS